MAKQIKPIKNRSVLTPGEVKIAVVGIILAVGVLWTCMQLTKTYLYNLSQMNQPVSMKSTTKNSGMVVNTYPTNTVVTDNSKSPDQVTTDIVTDIDQFTSAKADPALIDSQFNDLNAQ